MASVITAPPYKGTRPTSMSQSLSPRRPIDTKYLTVSMAVTLSSQPSAPTSFIPLSGKAVTGSSVTAGNKIFWTRQTHA